MALLITQAQDKIDLLKNKLVNNIKIFNTQGLCGDIYKTKNPN
ncbi:MAG: hypothetical protein ACJAX3_002321 [Patiriisocius sp.]|jgi:hypothetical protein